MKPVYKRIVASALFIIGLLGALFLVSRVLAPKGNEKADGMHDPAANGILAEPQNTIDVLILGDSESYASFIPLQMWEEYGFTAYCCGTSAQNLSYSEQFLHKVFKSQSPKIVVLETHEIYVDFDVGVEVLQKLDTLFPVFSYHNRWKTLSSKDLNLSVNYSYIDNAKGYQFDAAVNAVSVKNYMMPTDRSETVSERNRNYVKNMRDFCNKHGAKLILVSVPSPLNWNMARHNGMTRFCRELGLDYYDLNLKPKEVPIDWNHDVRDKKGDHLNHYGAVKVTKYFGGCLWETGLLTDRRNDEAYTPWNEALRDFNATVASQLPRAGKGD